VFIAKSTIGHGKSLAATLQRSSNHEKVIGPAVAQADIQCRKQPFKPIREASA
jgi:hypothetical protein